MTKIILDCDPGHDDAIAILLAGLNPNIDLLGITTESGNQTIDKTSKNAYNVTRYLDLNIPISKGASHPIIKDVEVCAEIHGESGLDGFTFPDYDYLYDERHAVNFIIDTLLKNEDVTMVLTGPETNLALALRMEPKIKDHIKEIIVMGGSMGLGNVSPAAEFNILCDPEAAYIVFNSGIKVKMIGLDVTRKVLVLPEILEKVKKINTKSAKLFYDLMIVFNENQKKTFGFKGAPLHDPATILSIIDPDVITFKPMHVDIDISHNTSYGRTNCDYFNYQKKEVNALVAVDVDVKKYFEIILDHLKIEDKKEDYINTIKIKFRPGNYPTFLKKSVLTITEKNIDYKEKYYYTKGEVKHNPNIKMFNDTKAYLSGEHKSKFNLEINNKDFEFIYKELEKNMPKENNLNILLEDSEITFEFYNNKNLINTYTIYGTLNSNEEFKELREFLLKYHEDDLFIPAYLD